MAKFTIVIDAPYCNDVHEMLNTLKDAIHTECNLTEHSVLYEAEIKVVVDEDMFDE